MKLLLLSVDPSKLSLGQTASFDASQLEMESVFLLRFHWIEAYGYKFENTPLTNCEMARGHLTGSRSSTPFVGLVEGLVEIQDICM